MEEINYNNVLRLSGKAILPKTKKYIAQYTKLTALKE